MEDPLRPRATETTEDTSPRATINCETGYKYGTVESARLFTRRLGRISSPPLCNTTIACLRKETPAAFDMSRFNGPDLVGENVG